MQTLLGKHWHHMPSQEIIALLDADPKNGLDVFELKRRLSHFGPNTLTPRRGKSPLERFILQFHNPLTYILLVAGVATTVVKDLNDAITIFAVVLFNAIVGYIQEAKAEKAIEALAQTLVTEALVLRSGQMRTVPAAELVPGDIVILQAGHKVPADMYLLRSRDLQIAESALTGESAPVHKTADTLLPKDTSLADRRNMAYASTLVTYGQANGLVIATGDSTEVGRISQLIAKVEDLSTPLTRKLAHLSNILLYAILALAGLVFVIGIARGQPLVDMLLAAIALAVGAIPEGLPAAVTVTLAIGVARMARRKAVIRKLPAVETLGSTTVICSDKTGTLTQNQMTVQQIIAGGLTYTVGGVGYTPVGAITPPTISENIAASQCLLAGQLCNDSSLIEKQGKWEAHGDPTEVALIVAARKGGIARVPSQLERIDLIPFDSQLQYMATMHDAGQEQPRIIYIKGSVEAILDKCSDVLTSTGELQPLVQADILKEVETMAAQGLRVLAFARDTCATATIKLNAENISSGLTFLGLQAMIDPPRLEVQAAVKACYDAGVQVKMITGDHALTARAIAGQIGLRGAQDGDNLKVLTGSKLAKFNDTELIEEIADTAIFARVVPEQKLRLVQALQASGHIVAMTGDGVNDAPALKQADIGVAMGIAGTEVAKEASAMVLTDDNFASIEAAIEEGRCVFDNLTKFIIWSLPTNVGIGLVVLVGVLFNVPLPMLPAQILWINMTTAGALGLALALEAKEPKIMQRPPRNPKDPIVSNTLIRRILVVGGLILVSAFGLYELEQLFGASIAQARTAAVNTVVLIQLFYLFNSRSLTRPIKEIGIFSNRWVIGGSILMIILQVLFTYSTLMHSLFSSASIGIMSWLVAGVAGLASYFIVELEKRSQFT